ncbi:uracil-DNA glycosylase family protein [Kordiimonas sp. SCSIO 12610]|nr:uracil-DNA glycosylase family protein [Kordiimonas sp. SCSIO 12610]UTW55905.1 uracil-DNA glycosylase family protein [Kordiimonas sp. SCSIO 12610]
MSFQTISEQAKACEICNAHLPMGPRPVFQIHPNARVLIAGQAPGIRVHETGIPFNDPSGKRLREWMGIDDTTFYDAEKVAILPMGFCYPGTGKSGDLPPRPECADNWRQAMLDLMPDIDLTLVIGQYAIKWHLKERAQKNLTETVRNWADYFDDGLMPLPHPSPRNNIWLKKNQWFEGDVLPAMQEKIQKLIG